MFSKLKSFLDHYSNNMKLAISNFSDDKQFKFGLLYMIIGIPMSFFESIICAIAFLTHSLINIKNKKKKGSISKTECIRDVLLKIWLFIFYFLVQLFLTFEKYSKLYIDLILSLIGIPV